jgi:zinc/manganese transport system permease protein
MTTLTSVPLLLAKSQSFLDSDFVHTMQWPFLACLLMAGILVNFGIHVIERQVIFVDLALAQIAAFGVVFGGMLGWDVQDDTLAIRGFSLVFTFLGAAIFSLTRVRHEKVPHEALIGITYAVAFAATILATSKLGHGAEEVKDLQEGTILFVKPSTVGLTALLYAGIGVMHFLLRRKFVLISVDPAAAEAQGLRVRLWDFLFYVSFGFVVTSAVSIAGVLLVFSYLVIPAVIAVLFARRVATRLAIGWTVGALVSMAGISLSWAKDLPPGPVTVVVFAGALVLAGLARAIVASETKAKTLARFAIGAGAIVFVVFGSNHWLTKEESRELIPFLRSAEKSERLQALGSAEADDKTWPLITREPGLLAQLFHDPAPEVRARIALLADKRRDRSTLESVRALLKDSDDHVRETAVRVVRSLADPKGDPKSVAALLAAGSSEEDEYLRAEMGEAVLELADPRGFDLLLDVMEKGEAEQARRDALEHVTAHAKEPVAFDPAADDPARAAAVKALRARHLTLR